MEHVCSSCGGNHSRFRDAEHIEAASLCSSCHARYMRENRPKHRDLPLLQRLKANARSLSAYYEKTGKLVKMPCEKCGDSNSQKHHDDYHKPLEVRWMCRECHLQHHRHEMENSMM